VGEKFQVLEELSVRLHASPLACVTRVQTVSERERVRKGRTKSRVGGLERKVVKERDQIRKIYGDACWRGLVGGKMPPTRTRHMVPSNWEASGLLGEGG